MYSGDFHEWFVDINVRDLEIFSTIITVGACDLQVDEAEVLIDEQTVQLADGEQIITDEQQVRFLQFSCDGWNILKNCFKKPF